MNMLTALSEKMHFNPVTTGFHPPLFCQVMLHHKFLVTVSFGGHGNYGVRPGCLLGNQSLELTDSAHHFGVILVCCEVWIAVVSIFLHVLCHKLKDITMVFDIKQHL